MRTALLIIALSVSLAAQEAEAPAIDPELLLAWQRQVALAEQIVSREAKALSETPEWKAYKTAEAQRDTMKKAITAKVKTKAPGYELDFVKGTLKPEAPQTASK